MLKFVIIRKEESKYLQFAEPSLKRLKQAQTCDIYPTDDKGIAHYYNKGLQAYLNQQITDEDIICFMHQDVSILDPYFTEKLEKVFKIKPEIAALGIAGSSILPESGHWFENPDEVKGQWIQSVGDKTIVMNKGKIGYYDDILTTHKALICVRPFIFKEGLRFDEELKIDYNVTDLCLQILDRGYKIAIADILIHHESEREGNFNIDYFKYKYESMGYKFPITLDQFKNLNNLEGAEIVL